MTAMLTKNFQTLQAEVAKHVAADQVIQGAYWDNKEQKGCFIGCLTHSSDALSLKTEYGIPLMLTKIAENIFEGLSLDEAVKFFKKFPKAVACDNKDLSLVSWKFLQFELENLPHKTKEVQNVIDGIGKLARGEKWDRKEARAAASAAAEAAAWAADAAAWTAEAAAWTAAASAAAARSPGWAGAAAATWAAARADDARAAAMAVADAAEAAAWATDWAADAAEAAADPDWAADDAARANAAVHDCRKQQAKTLLRLIEEAPVITENN